MKMCVSFLVCGKVFVRLELSCQSSLKLAYYGATKTEVHKDVCYQCEKVDATFDKEFLKCYKTTINLYKLPTCKCRKGAIIKKTLIHTPAAKHALTILNLQNKKIKK